MTNYDRRPRNAGCPRRVAMRADVTSRAPRRAAGVLGGEKGGGVVLLEGCVWNYIASG